MADLRQKVRQLRGELEGREKALELARRTVERLMADKGSLEAEAAGGGGPEECRTVVPGCVAGCVRPFQEYAYPSVHCCRHVGTCGTLCIRLLAVLGGAGYSCTFHSTSTDCPAPGPAPPVPCDNRHPGVRA